MKKRRFQQLAIALVLTAASAICANLTVADGDTHRGEAKGPTMPQQALAWLDDQLRAIDKARDLIAAKQEVRRDEHGLRVRATYKAIRMGAAPLWLDADKRAVLVAQRSAARRLLRRDFEEMALLQEEMDVASTAREQLVAERQRATELVAPAPRSLRSPVAWSEVIEPFGLYRDKISGARLSRRGVWLSARPGRNVRAIESGKVLYVGPARGLGQTVIIDHGDYTSISGALTKIKAVRGQQVSSRDILGESEGDRVYLEIRLDVGPGGFPVDPEPILEWR